MTKLQIGSVSALLSTDAQHTPDDRQELIKTVTLVNGTYVPGVIVPDNGVCEAGETISYTGVVFKPSDWAVILNYWKNRSLVQVVGVGGVVYPSCRIIVKQWTRNKTFTLVTTDIEIWRV